MILTKDDLDKTQIWYIMEVAHDYNSYNEFDVQYIANTYMNIYRKRSHGVRIAAALLSLINNNFNVPTLDKMIFEMEKLMGKKF